MRDMAAFAKPLLGMIPPDPNAIDLRGLLDAAGLGRAFRRLGARRQHLLIQLLSSSALDFVERWFESEPLKATLAASGIIGTFLGIRSPGTAYVLLHHYMGEIDGAFRSWGLPRGGTGAVSMAIAGAATEAGAVLRTSSPVARILVEGGTAVGVVLESGEEIRAKAVASSADLRVTFARLVGLEHLPAEYAGARARLPLPRRDRQGQPRARRAAPISPAGRVRGRTSPAPSRSRRAPRISSGPTTRRSTARRRRVRTWTS